MTSAPVGTDGLFWVRSGWSVVLVLASLLGTLVAVLGIRDDLHAAYSESIQNTETGQVQITGSDGEIDNYFLIRAYLESLPGVEATTARRDIRVLASVPGVAWRSISIRICNFAQEDKVTGFRQRLAERGQEATSGLVLSRELSRSVEWAPATLVSMVPQEDPEASQGFWVTGHVAKAPSARLEELSYLDSSHAEALLGHEFTATVIAVRLSPRVGPQDWIESNRNSFRRLELKATPWDQVTPTRFSGPQAALGAADSVLWSLAGLAAGLLVLVGLLSRGPRSGYSGRFRGHWTERMVSWATTLTLAVPAALLVAALVVPLVRLVLAETDSDLLRSGWAGLGWRPTWVVLLGLVGSLVLFSAVVRAPCRRLPKVPRLEG